MLDAKIAQLADYLLNKQLKMGTAESCTGGGLSNALTLLPGSSRWFDRGLITYSNEAKMSLLHVPAKTLLQYGAVSQETAHAMVDGLLGIHLLDAGIAITGIAGPDGGSTEKPVGTVWIAWKVKADKTESRHYQFNGNRAQIRQQSIEAAIDCLLSQLIER